MQFEGFNGRPPPWVPLYGSWRPSQRGVDTPPLPVGIHPRRHICQKACCLVQGLFGLPRSPGLGSSPRGPVAQTVPRRASAGQTSASYCESVGPTTGNYWELLGPPQGTRGTTQGTRVALQCTRGTTQGTGNCW